MPLTIRPATQDDHTAIADLYEAADARGHQLLPDFMRSPSDIERPMAELEAQMADPSAALLVAEDARGVVGLVMAVIRDSPPGPTFVSRRYADVVDVVVSAEARREGIGSRLMAAAEKWARAQGADSLDLIVVEGNDGAQDLYRGLGYEMRSHRMWKRLR